MMLQEKLRKHFADMVVFKDPERSQSFSALSMPSYLRDWLIMRYSDQQGQADMPSIMQFMDERLPRREQWDLLLHKMMYKNEEVTILAKVRTQREVSSGETYFSLPDYSFPKRKSDAVVDAYVVNNFGEELTKIVDTWGVVTMEYRMNEKGEGQIRLTDFSSFCPYAVELEQYRAGRANFSTEEWIDILLSAVDLNPEGYISLRQKMTTISRLLPFAEKRLNLIELAPKGTGKSYIFSRISKYGWLASGSMTRAKLFYDMSAKMNGLLARYDYVAMDEIASFTFPDESEMQATLKGYLESGQYKVGNYDGVADAGLILLGNINEALMNEDIDMFAALPGLFHSDSALLDRFHGFVKGWDIPRMRSNLVARGWALNVEYFSEIIHAMREEARYRTVVDELIVVPGGADVRDTEAVKRIATGFLKLIFPHVTAAKNITIDDFDTYCFSPAVEMRRIVKKQMGIIDREFRGKRMPELSLR